MLVSAAFLSPMSDMAYFARYLLHICCHDVIIVNNIRDFYFIFSVILYWQAMLEIKLNKDTAY